MQITATTNANALNCRLNNAFARQLPFATALALTTTAKAIREAERAEMTRVFDRPTPFTLNAFQVLPARKDTLVAEVTYKDYGLSPNHYLENQVTGGARGKTRLERRMLPMALPEQFAAVIPALKATRDAYGNWSAGERNRVLSALQLQADPRANETAASRKRARRTVEYYHGRRGAVEGIWRRQGDEDRLILLFVRKVPTYTPRFDFDGVARRTFAAVYEATFEAAIQRALATAR